MFQPGRRITSIGRRSGLGVLVAVCSVASAGAASAATLSAAVPSKIAKNKGYAIALHGSFQKSELSGRAYLISVIQFSSKPCLASAQAEAIHRARSIQFYLAPHNDPRRGKPGVFEKKSPFRNKRSFTAGTLGVRHVCAYLYPKFVPGETSRIAPIAKADASYKVTAH
jgi:hypothetical protein